MPQATQTLLSLPRRSAPCEPRSRKLQARLKTSAVVTDVGSTKCSVIDDARTALGAAFPRFVPAHPIAGGERPGVEHAAADLFRNRLVITTPIPATDASATALVEELWRKVGARLERLSPEQHDKVFAAVSHLPHLLAFALVEMIARGPDAETRFSHAGAGFRDFTRIAASSPDMWRDVCLANRGPLAKNCAPIARAWTSFRPLSMPGTARPCMPCSRQQQPPSAAGAPRLDGAHPVGLAHHTSAGSVDPLNSATRPSQFKPSLAAFARPIARPLRSSRVQFH